MPLSRRDVLTVPNLLSFYRLATAPLIVALAVLEERTLVVVLLCVSFATDILDGLIARLWDRRTRFGSQLDSVADECTYIAALVGVFRFEYEALRPDIAIFYVYLACLFAATLVPVVKYRRIPSFHLYSSKANALLQALFIFQILVFDFNAAFYYVVMAFGILACIELIAVVLVLDEAEADARGLYWVLRKTGRSR